MYAELLSPCVICGGPHNGVTIKILKSGRIKEVFSHPGEKDHVAIYEVRK